MTSAYVIGTLTESVRSYWEQYYQDYANVWGEPVTKERFDTIWSFLHSQNYQAYGLGLYLDDALVGFAHYMLYPCTYSASLICYIQDIYVSPEHRNKGQGRKLIKHIAEIGEKEGWRRVHWKTMPNNFSAQRLYDSIAKRDDTIHYQLDLL